MRSPLPALLAVLLAFPASGRGEEGPIPAERLMPLEARRMRYALRVDDRERAADASLVPAEEAGEERSAGWWLRMGEHRHSLLRREADGAIHVLHQRLPRDGMEIVYEPSVVLLPARCAPGETVESTGSIRIETQDGTTRRGELTHRVRIAGRERVETPAGEREAVLVETRDEIDLGWVELTIEARTHYVPGLGRARQRMVTERRTLAVFGSTSKESFRVRTWRVPAD